MALTYEQSSALMADATFRGRIEVACLKFADYIYGEATNTPGHSTRIKWQQATMLNPSASAAQVTPTVVMDPAVQDSSTGDGSDVTDAQLQSATENAVNKVL